MPFSVAAHRTPMKPAQVQVWEALFLNRTGWPFQPRFLEQRTLGVCPPPTFEGHPGVERLVVRCGVSMQPKGHLPCSVSSLAGILSPGKPGPMFQRESFPRGTRRNRRGRYSRGELKSGVLVRLFGDDLCVDNIHMWGSTLSFHCHGRGREGGARGTE